ncbi:hypothetical protein E2986_14161 [Frieseomelitta varia]|uniref:SRCR domain-containing protein n=1 Tax=Frieseomelitta varia TaxID=561572 RepID=A0A833RC73_9HYME|nr:hypothetical protein E2986_14161 [Frieseomelitta varia]
MSKGLEIRYLILEIFDRLIVEVRTSLLRIAARLPSSNITLKAKYTSIPTLQYLLSSLQTYAILSHPLYFNILDGEPHAPILLTAVEANNQVHPVESPLSIRLVDGPTPFEGRLELLHRGDWRAVCTNSRNHNVSVLNFLLPITVRVTYDVGIPA